MGRWMHGPIGQMGGWMGGWMNRMYGYMDERVEEWFGGWPYIYVRMNGCIRQMDG